MRRVIKGYSYKTQSGQTEKVAGLGGEFSYARVGRALMDEYRDLGRKLPSYEEMARYIYFTETSQNFDPAQIDAETGKIGEWKDTSYYLPFAEKAPFPELNESYVYCLRQKAESIAHDVKRGA